MSAEGEGKGGADTLKPPNAPKAPTVTSAFINKGAKTFAPKKAVRRRPPAAPGATKPSQPVQPPASTSTPAVEENSQTSSLQAQSDLTTGVESQNTPLQSTPNVEPQDAPQAESTPLFESQTTPQRDSTPPTGQQTTVQLPTPAATQEQTQQDIPRAAQVSPEPLAAASNSSAPRPSVAVPESLPTPLATDAPAQSTPVDSLDVIPTQSEVPTARPPVIAEEQPASQLIITEPTPDVQGKPAQAPVIQSAQPEQNQSTATATTQAAGNDVEPIPDAPPPAAASTAFSAIPATPAEHQSVPEENIPNVDNVPATGATEEPTSTNRTWNAVNAAEENGDRPAVAPKLRKPTGRRRAKPVTLRNMEEEEEEARGQAEVTEENGDSPAVAPKTLRPPGRRRAKAVTLRNIEEEEEELRTQAEGGHVPTPPKKSSARARGKRKAADAADGDRDDTVRPPAKKARQPRKTKAKVSTSATLVQNGEPGQISQNGQAENAQTEENAQSVENGETNGQAVRPKTTKKRKRQTTSQPDGGGEGEEGEPQPKRKGRPAREPTPSDAENEAIDESQAFMDDLARGTIRSGKLSSREKKMRTMNWDEVKERQRARAQEQRNSRAKQAEMERALQEKYAAREEKARQPMMVTVDGQIQYVERTITVEEEEPEEIEEFEEDDFTNRINRTSFMRNNKRYPEELMLPGQAKRWDIKSTADFYEALKMFGTDFGMMVHRFQNVTRRSLKRKFNREERENPEAIKKILQNKETRVIDWEGYLRGSGRDEQALDKVEQIKRDLAEEEKRMEDLINQAKEEAAREKYQRQLAGVDSEEDEGENATGKKMKGKKNKGKQVTFQQEDVEILEFDDDDGWGQE